MKQQILALAQAGKSRKEIIELLGCAKSTICYHLTDGQKEKQRTRNSKVRRAFPIRRKWYRFSGINLNAPKVYSDQPSKQLYHKVRDFFKDQKTKTMVEKPKYKYEEVMAHIGENPVCYLTGRAIDLSKPTTYHFDHVIPSARGGNNSLENLGVCIREVNFAKRDLMLQEFYQLCKDVVTHLEASGIVMRS